METITGNGVISNVDALVYVVLSRAETHVPYGELVGAIEYTNNVVTEVSHKP